MAQYGFKLFKTERMNGNGYTPVPFVDKTWGDFTDHLVRSYERQLGRKWHEDPKDAFTKDGELLPLNPNSRIVRLDWLRREGMSVFFGLSSGKNDGFVDAMTAADGSPDVTIEHLAPRRQYRGVYTLPPDETAGVLALEVVSRSCPVVPLRKWSTRWSQDLVRADELEKKTSQHCRMTFDQLTDSNQVQSLLNGGDPQEIVLIEHASAGDGLPRKVQYKLTAPVRQKTTAMGLVKGWIQDQSKSTADGIAEARALVGPGIGDTKFDDCYVAVKHEGQTQHVRPDAYSELFIYDNKTAQRETDDFFRKVNEKLASLGLAGSMGLGLKGWPTGLPQLRPETD